MSAFIAMLKHAAVYPVAGMPLWSFLLMFVVLPVLNEIVQRKQSISAQSLLQWVGDGLKASPLYVIPLAKQLINLICTPAKPAIQQPDNAGPIKVSVLLPFAFMLALGQGCAGWRVFGQCFGPVAPAVAETIVTDVIAILANPSGYVEALAQLGEQYGAKTVNCIVASVEADEKANGVVRAHASEFMVKQKAAGKLSCR